MRQKRILFSIKLHAPFTCKRYGKEKIGSRVNSRAFETDESVGIILRSNAAKGELAARIVRKHTLVARAYFLRRGVKQPRKMCHRGNSHTDFVLFAKNLELVDRE